MPGSADEWMSIVRRSFVLECNSPKYANCEARNVVGAAVVGGPPVWARGSLGAPVCAMCWRGRRPSVGAGDVVGGLAPIWPLSTPKRVGTGQDHV